MNERQMKVLKYIETHPNITNKELREILNLSDEGARKELQVLLENGLIERRSAGRSTHYILVGD
ncbi:MAG: winged helix-turn-helix transcriptional regulator [Candidatus Hydrothermarchaeaceae archaeon]